MPVPIFTHPACLLHDPGPGHPETPARLGVLLDRLRRDERLAVTNAAAGDKQDLLLVHPDGYLVRLEELSSAGGGPVFLDTVMNEWSWAAILGAVGSVHAALQHAHAGRGHAFAAVRPPGHHALSARAMGFCLVNNVVVAARASQALGRRRVLIIDWDVHHGNGTQALVESDPAIRYVSLHQHPWYPGTGMADERGVGNVFNVPRGPGMPARIYVEDLWAAILAATATWEPDFVLISSGFDAMQGDPLGGFTLEPEHYAEWTTLLREHLPGVPIVSMLEGGYIPQRIAEGAAAHAVALG